MSKYLSFSEILCDNTRYATKIEKTQYLETGKYVIIDQGNNKIAGYCNEPDGLYNNIPAIIFGDHTRIIKYVDAPCYIGADGVKLLSLNAKYIGHYDYKYLYYYLSCQKILDTGYNRHFKWLKAIDILHLPLVKQQEIVNILDKASELLSMRKRQLAELDVLVESVFYDMFGDPVKNEKGWGKGVIGDICYSVNYGTSTPSLEGGKYKYLRMNNITYNGDLDMSNLKYIDIEDKDYEKYVVRKGDLLFNRTNSKELVGKTTIIQLDEEMIIAGYIIRVRFTDTVLPIFVARYMNTVYIKQYLRGLCKSIIGQANINAKELQSIPIYFPPIELQNQFAQIIEKIENQKEQVRNGIRESEGLFQKLMQDLFK